MRWYREIRRVGLRDWLWFVVGLRRDEFHPKLNRVHFPMDRAGSLLCMRARDRAHNIDLALTELA